MDYEGKTIEECLEKFKGVYAMYGENEISDGHDISMEMFEEAIDHLIKLNKLNNITETETRKILLRCVEKVYGKPLKMRKSNNSSLDRNKNRLEKKSNCN